jgi:hypothetical protein
MYPFDTANTANFIILSYPVLLRISVTTAFTDPSDMDSSLVSEEEEFFLPIYDPSAGFITGSGWIISEAGAYKPDETLFGKANFGFASKYQKGQTVPTGNTQFVFHATGGGATMSFHSDVCERLVISNKTANYQCTGRTARLEGVFNFRVWATDNGTSGDTFRIRIWNAGSRNAPGRGQSLPEVYLCSLMPHQLKATPGLNPWTISPNL